jgi:predicted nuclease with TOPRIM domain
MALTPEAWTVIGTGVVILIAIATSNRQLRSEMNSLRSEVKEIHGEIGRLRERMAKLEGLLESLREAITGRKAA